MKFLLAPVWPYGLNQGFGANLPCSPEGATTPVVTGADNNTCPPGYSKLYPKLGLPKGHNGLDLKATRWQPVYAPCSGWVSEVSTEVERGLGIGIITDRKYWCEETKTESHFHIRLWHHIALDTHKGEFVNVGDLVAYADSTGFSSGDHVHFEIKPVTITKWNQGVPIKWTNPLQSNGFYGAVDPLPYLRTDMSALRYAGIWRNLKELIARLSTLLADKVR